ncbi:MAG: hypothetical protein AAF657_02465 [Acidobacteriota bacterium]
MLLTASGMVLPKMGSSQLDPGVMPVRIFELLDTFGTRFGTVLVTTTGDRGYKARYETWRCSEATLLAIAEQESLTLSLWAAGDWDDPWVLEALAWQPADPAVEWSHPAMVEWTPIDEVRPPLVEEGITFGNPTLGGLTIRYSSHGPSSLTWFKQTEGDFMALGDGTVFERQREVPATGWWWHGPIERGS